VGPAFEGGRLQIALARLEERTHQIAHHVFQKTRAAYAVDQPFSGVLEHRREDRPHLGPAQRVARVGSGERREIVLAFHQANQARHRFHVERVRMMVNVAILERRAHFPTPDPILIRLGQSVVPRVKIQRSVARIQYPDGGGQQPVHGLPQVCRRYRVGDGKRRHLP
jgi:hypothetical protein